MLKKLVSNGSSWSLLIDTSMMKLLGLAPRGFVRCRIVDKQLIVQGAEDPEVTERNRAPAKRQQIARELSMASVVARLNAEGLKPEYVERLGYGGRWVLLLAHAQSDHLDHKHNALLRALLVRREIQPMFSGESWEDSIDAVKAEHGDLSDAVGNDAA
jgi:hypothetical protein